MNWKRIVAREWLALILCLVAGMGLSGMGQLGFRSLHTPKVSYQPASLRTVSLSDLKRISNILHKPKGSLADLKELAALPDESALRSATLADIDAEIARWYVPGMTLEDADRVEMIERESSERIKLKAAGFSDREIAKYQKDKRVSLPPPAPLPLLKTKDFWLFVFVGGPILGVSLYVLRLFGKSVVWAWKNTRKAPPAQ